MVERLEVAVVDADHRRAEPQGAIELAPRCAPRRGWRARRPWPRASRSRRSAPLERGHDQQHRVGAGGARLPELVLVDDELLAEHGDGDGRPHGDQIVEAALEVLRVGEHRDRGRARRPRRSAPGRPDRDRRGRRPADGEAFFTSAMRRTRSPVAGRRAASKSRAGASPRQAAISSGRGAARLELGQLRALVGDDLVEDAHVGSVVAAQPVIPARVMSMRAICSSTYSRSVRGGGRSRTRRPPAISGFSSASAGRPSGPTGAGARRGAPCSAPRPGIATPAWRPERLPRLAIGWPSISMMSSAKESTGALAIEVPTP